VDETGSGSCPLAGFVIDIEPLDSTVKVLVALLYPLFSNLYVPYRGCFK
jgi:hypothetical protein